VVPAAPLVPVEEQGLRPGLRAAQELRPGRRAARLLGRYGVAVASGWILVVDPIRSWRRLFLGDTKRVWLWRPSSPGLGSNLGLSWSVLSPSDPGRLGRCGSEPIRCPGV
jgi:hypothetical protein